MVWSGPFGGQPFGSPRRRLAVTGGGGGMGTIPTVGFGGGGGFNAPLPNPQRNPDGMPGGMPGGPLGTGPNDGLRLPSGMPGGGYTGGPVGSGPFIPDMEDPMGGDRREVPTQAGDQMGYDPMRNAGGGQGRFARRKAMLAASQDQRNARLAKRAKLKRRPGPVL